MKVAVTGATGNVGTAVIRALSADPAVEEVRALARRPPADPPPWSPTVHWCATDVVESDLRPAFAGIDTVVHLAWLIQPSRRRPVMRSTNVDGSARVLEAAARAGCTKVVVASSVGAYSPGSKERLVDETWPTDGIETSSYSRDKAAVERLMDRFEEDYPKLPLVRMRPGLIFQTSAASEIARLFLGPFVPTRILGPIVRRIVPRSPRLRAQVVHADDVADAYRRAVLADCRGPFNVAADPVLDGVTLAQHWSAHPTPIPERLLRAAADVSWRLRVVPTDAGWVDLALESPLMDTQRIHDELGWSPACDALQTIDALMEGFAHGSSGRTPPLAAGHRSGVTTDTRPGSPD